MAQQYAVYSSDGVTWTQVTIRTSSDAWMQVCYDDGKFVAVSNTKYIVYTTDGVTWTTTFVNATGTNPTVYFGVCYGNGKWIVIDYNNGITKYSTDLVSWTEGSLGASYMWRWVLFGLGKFIAMTSTSKIAYSTDAITWTIIDTPGYFTKMRYINNKFYSFDGNSKKNMIYYSTDAINLTSITLSSIAYMSDICYDSSKYIISCGGNSYDTSYFLYSTDGITWSQQTLSISKPWNTCASNGSVTVIIGYNTNICMYSMSYPNLDYVD